MDNQIYRRVFLGLFFLGLKIFGGDANFVSANRRFLLQKAIDNNNLLQVQDLLRQGANPNSLDCHGSTALIQAIQCGRSKIVELLLDLGADPNCPSDFGRTALMQASIRGDLNIVQALIRRSANINAQDRKFKSTALMWAVGSEHDTVVRFLLESGADLDLLDVQGKNVYASAQERCKNKNILKLIKLAPFFKTFSIEYNSFDSEPKPENYIDDIYLPAAESFEDAMFFLGCGVLQKYEEQIEAFERDHTAYWQAEFQKAYLQYLDDDKNPLINLILHRHALTSLFASYFKSRGLFINFLERVARDSDLSSEDAENLVRIWHAEKDAYRSYRAVQVLQSVWKKVLAEKVERKFSYSYQDQAFLSAKKIQDVWKEHCRKRP